MALLQSSSAIVMFFMACMHSKYPPPPNPSQILFYSLFGEILGGCHGA